MGQHHTHQTINALNKDHVYITLTDLHKLSNSTFDINKPHLLVRIGVNNEHVMLKDENDVVVAWSHKTYPQLTPNSNF